jgi:hypothetical protein
VQRRNLLGFGKIPASFRPLPGQRSARRADRGAVVSPGGGRSQEYVAQGPLMAASSNTGTPCGVQLRRFGASASAPPSLQQQIRRPCRQRVPYGPTRDAPDYVADRTSGKTRTDAERSLRLAFGSAGNRFGGAPAIAFRPSPHPRIRWTVASSVRAVSAHGHTRPPPPRVAKCPTKC